MKTIIAGGRDVRLSAKDLLLLDNLKSEITEVVCGCARGVDTDGRSWAIRLSVPYIDFPADWKRYNLAAGGIRNEQMAVYADALIVFSGNTGTNDMFKRAVKHKLKIHDFRHVSSFKYLL